MHTYSRGDFACTAAAACCAVDAFDSLRSGIDMAAVPLPLPLPLPGAAASVWAGAAAPAGAALFRT